MIPEAAVEAAARGMYMTVYPDAKWEDRPDRQFRYQELARAALEAAAPHMVAEALGEGDEAWDSNRVAIGANPFKSEA